MMDNQVARWGLDKADPDPERHDWMQKISIFEDFRFLPYNGNAMHNFAQLYAKEATEMEDGKASNSKASDGVASDDEPEAPVPKIYQKQVGDLGCFHLFADANEYKSERSYQCPRKKLSMPSWWAQ
jgi:hypothetical protein